MYNRTSHTITSRVRVLAAIVGLGLASICIWFWFFIAPASNGQGPTASPGSESGDNASAERSLSGADSPAGSAALSPGGQQQQEPEQTKPFSFDISKIDSFTFQHNDSSACKFSRSDHLLSIGGWRPSSGGVESRLNLATGLLEEHWTMAAYGMGSGSRTVTPFGDGRYPGMLRSLAQTVSYWKNTNPDAFGGSRPDRTLRDDERRSRDRLIALLNATAARYPKGVHIPERDVSLKDESGEQRAIFLSVRAPGATRATLIFDFKPSGNTETLWKGIPYAFASQLEPRADTQRGEQSRGDLSFQPMERTSNGRFSGVVRVPYTAPALWYMFVVEDATGHSSNVTQGDDVFRWAPK